MIISDMTVLLCGSSQTHLGTQMPSGDGQNIKAAAPAITTTRDPALRTDAWQDAEKGFFEERCPRSVRNLSRLAAPGSDAVAV